MNNTPKTLRRMALLRAGLSLIALAAVPATANAASVIFTVGGSLGVAEQLTPGREYSLSGGTTQVELDGDITVSFVGPVQFAIDTDGAVLLRAGTATAVTPGGAQVTVRLPGGISGTVSGANGSASFTAAGSTGHGSVLGGHLVFAGANAPTRSFAVGSFWRLDDGGAIRRTLSNGATDVADPGSDDGKSMVASVKRDGIAGAARNGVPIALAEALAASGASGDIVMAASRIEAYSSNPTLARFPTGDFALLSRLAVQLSSPYGGPAFPSAGADIVRAYFQYLAGGGARTAFLTSYAGIFVNYLDIVRAGVLPGNFTGATQAQLSAYIAFIGRTQGFGSLTVANRTLLDAYLAFLSSGGTPNGFAPQLGNLTTAYLDFLRRGGDPVAFTGASQSVLLQYLTIVQSGGIRLQLSTANQVLLTAYLESLTASGNGLAFSTTAATGLAAFVSYLNLGGFPSAYTAVDIATVRRYLETLQTTGLFDRLLGTQADFLRAYLAFLQTGGSPDNFAQLPITVLTGRATALNAYIAYIQSGGVPSAYTLLSQAQVLDYLRGLQGAGLFDRLLGENARFFSEYYTYLQTGSDPDYWAGLPTVDITAYAQAISTFVAYLRAGNLPSGYTALSAAEVRAYLNALSISGRLGTLFGADAALLTAYLAHVQGGGIADTFTGLPIVTYRGYADALTAYYAYLSTGGLPSGYTPLTQAQIRTYLEALQASGQLTMLLGDRAAFLVAYVSHVQAGGSIDSFAQLPAVTFRSYADALASYYVYLAGGGIPSAYAQLTQTQIRTYLEALQRAGQVAALLGANATFLASYLTYVQGGGMPDQYAQLPIAPVVPGEATGRLTTYTGGFVGGLGGRAFGVNAGTSHSGSTSPTISATGQFISATSIGNISAKVADVAGDDRAIIGRFHDGTVRFAGSIVNLPANGGLPYVLLAPTIGSLPTSGVIDYNLLSGTRPVYSNGITAPGVFDATMSIGFGTQLTYKLSGAIIMPEATGAKTYNFTSPGYAQGLMRNVAMDSTGALTMLGDFSDLGQACSGAGCTIQFYGGFGGANPQERLGLTYQTYNGPNRLQGSAILAPVAAVAPPTGTAAPTGSALRVRVVGQTFVTGTTSRAAQGSFMTNSGSVTASADGQTSAIPLGPTPTTRITAANVDNGTAGGVIGWSRWAGGTLSDSEVPANGGLSHIWGTPATSLPTSGRVSYAMIGSTRPIYQSGAIEPGSVSSAQLAVDFASRNVGFNAQLAINSRTVAVGSTGGVGAPSMALGVDGTFSQFGGSAHIMGFLAGPQGQYAGVSYNVFGPGISGVIAFQAPR